MRDDRPGPANLPSAPVIVLLDPIGDAVPVTIPSVGAADSRNAGPDDSATWQRLAPP